MNRGRRPEDWENLRSLEMKHRKWLPMPRKNTLVISAKNYRILQTVLRYFGLL